MIVKNIFAAVALTTFATCSILADATDFKTGPLIKQYGPVAEVPSAEPLAPDTTFSVAFDVSQGGAEGAVNRGFESAARFLNMHAVSGVRPDNMKLAIIVHGEAVTDLTKDTVYGGSNKNAELVKALLAHGVTVQVCGQSAAFRGVNAEDLLPGVKMAVSAMTAHALLQQQGFTLNPF